jgi:hypothetical protein
VDADADADPRGMTSDPPPPPPGFLGDWCETLARGSESPPASYLATGLAVLSAAVGPRLIIQWSPAHEERCNLWLLAVGESALARKTSGAAALRRAVGWMRAGGDDLVRLLRVTRLSDAGLVAALDVVGPETEAARKKLPEEERAGTDPVVRPVPVSWVVIANEVAPVWIDDGTSWALDAQRLLLSIYDGVLSSTTKQTSVPDQECYVTCLGNIPISVLREQTTLGMVSSGWVGRWLVVRQPGPERDISFPQPAGDDLLERLRWQIDQLMALARRDARVSVRDLWSQEALDAREEWYVSWRERLRGSGDDRYSLATAELFERQQATAVKLATLVAVSRQLDEHLGLMAMTVEPQDALWSQSLVDASIGHVLDVLRDSGAESGTPLGQAESRIVRHLERSGARDRETARSARDVAFAAKGHRISYGDVRRAIETLWQMGIVQVDADGGRQMVWLA